MLASIKHVIPVTTIRRSRMLPIPGRVLVRKGQRVTTNDVVADAKISPEHILLDIGRGLGLPADEADQHLERQAGETVEAGDVIAGPVGEMARRVVRAPKAGRVALAGSGQVLVEVEGKVLELRAGFNGTVSELYPDHGVEIETIGALIQGCWGNGRMDFGLLHVLARSPEDVLKADRLDVSLRGSVIVGGHCQDPEVLTTAEELPLRGLILASMSAKLAPLAQKMRCPLIVIEGFGRLPMNSAAFNLLSTSQRREAAVMAERWDAYQGSRPEIIIPLPTETGEPLAEDVGEFRVGQRVRVVRPPYHGQLGTLEDINPDLFIFPSGIMAQAALVRLENDENVQLPLANLELLG
jgi:hypothetical protein